MSNLPLGEDLKKLFEDVTTGRVPDPAVRAILVQNDNGTLRLIDSLPPQGSDKEDFTDILGKLFAKEPTRPGYALFRLDSKSPAGLYEWLNCAFRPDGARVREKMQYAVTQASLLQGLSEQHFLETIYGATVRDFSFPNTLRNARKHDYQNPQLSTRGKAASEAAGTNAGGARRNFESVASAKTADPAPLPRAASVDVPKDAGQSTSASDATKAGTTDSANDQSASSDSVQPASTSFDLSESSNVPESDSQPPPAPEIVVEQTKASASPADADQKVESIPDGEKELAQGIAKGEGVDVPSTDLPSSQDTPAQTTTNENAGEPVSSKEDDTQNTTSSTGSSLQTSQLPVVAADLAAKAEVSQDTASASADSAAAGSSLSESSATKIEEPNLSKAAPEASAEPAPVASQVSDTTAAAPKAAVSSSTGVGRGGEGLATEKERHLAELKAQETDLRHGAGAQSGTGGARAGFSWNNDVESALQTLASASANFAILRVDLSKEEVQIAEQPVTVQPDEVAQTLSESQAKRDNEPSYALYVHPDGNAQASQGEKGVGFIYLCPLSCTVRQRMINSTNIAKLCKGIDSFDGLKLVKRLETADVHDLTADALKEAFVESEGDEGATPAASFSRPKRPGRK